MSSSRVVVAIGAAGAAFLLTPLLFFGSGSASAASAASAGGVTGGIVTAPLLGSVVRTTAALLPGVPAGGYPDAFPYGQCTYWAALNHRVTWSGNAGEWLANAAAQGVAMAQVPSLGALAVWPPGSGYDARYGHVAVVTAATPTAYTVSEMNYLGEGVVDARTVPWPDDRVLGFIP